jgi:hypothetical protein
MWARALSGLVAFALFLQLAMAPLHCLAAMAAAGDHQVVCPFHPPAEHHADAATASGEPQEQAHRGFGFCLRCGTLPNGGPPPPIPVAAAEWPAQAVRWTQGPDRSPRADDRFPPFRSTGPPVSHA